jgi:toxin ParE1/3/4
MRRHFSETFPYAVLYVDKTDHVLVLAVAHFKRRPGYWRERLP